MSVKARRTLVLGLLVAVLALVAAGCGEIPAEPPAGQGPVPPPPAVEQVDSERYAALKAQVEALREEGQDVSTLDAIISDIEMWIAQGEAAEANLRIKDLEGALADFETMVPPAIPAESPLPPAPAYVPVPETGETVLLEEDFAGPNALAVWQSAFLSYDPGNMATWQQRQEALYLDMGAGSMQIVGMVDVVGEDWGDYVYSVDIFPQGNLEVGAVFRYQEGAFYRFRFLSWEYSGRPTRLLERVSGDQVTILDQGEGPGYDPEQWHNVQIVAAGDQLTVYLDGEPVLQAQDDLLPQGKVGVYALSVGYVYFDNIRVTSVR